MNRTLFPASRRATALGSLVAALALSLGGLVVAGPAGAVADSNNVTDNTTGTTQYGQPVTFTSSLSLGAVGTSPSESFYYATVASPGLTDFTHAITGCTGLTPSFSGSGPFTSTVTCTTSALPVTVTEVAGLYSDSNYTPTPLWGDDPYAVTKANSTSTKVTISALPASPVAVGTSVTLTASVPHSNATGVVAPTGLASFDFSTDGSTFTSVPGCSNVSVGGGVATCVTTAIPFGTIDVNVTYSGDTNYASGTSSAYSYVVLKTSTVSVAASPASPVKSGTIVTLTATTGSGQTGSVLFQYSTDGTNYLSIAGCTLQPISLSTATCSTAALPAGTKDVEAVYLGDGNVTYLPSTSTALAYSVTGATTSTITIATSVASPVAVGTSVAITATVGAGQTGTVEFMSSLNGTTYTDVTSCSAVTISGVTAVCTTTALPTGTNFLEAVYSGNTTYASVTSTALPFYVAGAGASTVSLTALPASPQPAGTLVTMTATVGAGQTGTVAFQYSLNGTVFTTVSTCSAQSITVTTSSCVTNALPAGTVSLRAAYSGSATYAPSTGTLNYVVTGSTVSTITLGASPASPGAPGSPVTITATLGVGETGTVAFLSSSDGTTFTAITGCGAVVVSGTTAVCSTTLAAGIVALKATYSGNTTMAAATSSALPYVVEKVTGSVSVSTSPSTRVNFGTLVTISVAVGTGQTGTLALQWSRDGVNFSYVPGCSSLFISGTTVTCITSKLPAGTNYLRAIYSGDATYSPNVSGRKAFSVKATPASTTLSSFTGVSTTLTARMKAQITAFAQIVKANFDSKITIRAYARFGSAAQNRALSLTRAHVVASYFRTQLNRLGVTGVTIVSIGAGSRGTTTAQSNIVHVTAS
jgi:hypothetical protein